MEVEYELTPDDLYHFQWRGGTKSSIVKRARIKLNIYLLLILIFLSVLPAIGPDGFDLSLANFTWILTYPFVIVTSWLFQRRYMRRSILEQLKEEKPDRGQLGVHKIILNETGLIERTVVGESRTSWTGIHRVEQDEKYIYIYIGPHAAHIIPKRAFSNLQEAESFYQLANVSKQGFHKFDK